MRWIATYKCCNCNCEWLEPAGPTHCRSCGSFYVKWTNFEELKSTNGKTSNEISTSFRIDRGTI